MEQKLDLRIQKTYLALSRALLKAMGEKPFEDIRVNELCDRAMVRKSTFYKHFGDKYELLAFVV
ncbi:MAG: TetR family transcriptional regulator, partial [Lachnospiraceae bacterium]|nr:TetR family transcriptional regulator [Lachnospiraceae bacterium]